MKVLIAGATGRVGRVLTAALGDKYDLMLGDVRPVDDARYIPLDVMDREQVQSAVADCDVVAYLSIARAEDLGGTGSPEYCDAAFDVHVKGVFNVLEAAAALNGKRVIYASSVSAVSGYPPEMMVTSAHRHEGGGVYGITKGFGEELCRMYAKRGLPVVVLRLGHVYIEELGGKRGNASNRYLVHESDVASAFGAVLATPEPPYALIHVVGDNVGRGWDLSEAARLYGWEPKVRFDSEGRSVRL